MAVRDADKLLRTIIYHQLWVIWQTFIPGYCLTPSLDRLFLPYQLNTNFERKDVCICCNAIQSVSADQHENPWCLCCLEPLKRLPELGSLPGV